MTAPTSLSIWRTPEACQEISRGLSERQRAQPPVIRSKKRPHPSGVRGVLAPLQGAVVVGLVCVGGPADGKEAAKRCTKRNRTVGPTLKPSSGGTQENARVPPANFH